MKPNETLTINLEINWRTLAVLSTVICILALAYSAVSAQDGVRPTINGVQEEAVTDLPKQKPVVSSDPSELRCADGLLPTINGECVSPAVRLPITSAAAVTSSSGGSRHFYLTEAEYSPSVALAACASGYHMASLWEILDVSNLTYDYDHPAVHTKADSGYGPPSAWYGWVRTGFDSSNSSTAGMGNCLNWSSASIGDYGVAVQLANAWETTPGDVLAWDATAFTCNLTGPVWCVGD